MNAVNIRVLSLVVLLVAAALPLSAQPPAGDSDLLRQARRERELATQKAESDLRATLTRTRSMSAAEALGALKQMLADLDAHANLDASRKGDMVKALQNRIRQIETDARARGEKLPAAADEQKRARDASRRAELEQEEAEREKVKSVVTQVNLLLGQRRTQEAERVAQDLARQYPNNAAARIMGENASLQARIRDARDLLAQQASRHDAAMKDITRSTTLPKEDVEYDKAVWRKNAKSKFRGSGEPLTEKEQAILKALSKTMLPDWKGVKFETVIDELQSRLGAPVAIDRKALEEASIGTDALVNFSLPREVSVRTVLRKVLQDNGLGYVIRDELIYITTLAKTRDMLTTRTYYLGDIVTGNQLTTPPALLQQQEEAVVKAIIDSIKRSVDPLSWEGEGGKATIHYDPVTKALIVRQSAEVHMLLRNSMR